MSRFDRQCFLGPDSEITLHRATLAFVGLGGGGSHLVQQAAHLGIGGYVVIDPDHITNTNTNRLIGGILADIEPATPKVAIAARQIQGLQDEPRIVTIRDTWHNATDQLKPCDIIIGAVDSFIEREQLERFARRHLIPYIDIGMDVHDLGNKEYLIGGQVILSIPGRPCLRCCGLITDDRLKLEANNYGAAGSRPQVVWPNGVLASSAVGLVVQLLTPWFTEQPDFVYLDYDGNRGTLTPNPRMQMLRDSTCPHHPPTETGDPLFDIREFNTSGAAGDLKPIQSAPEAAVSGWQSLKATLARLFRRRSNQ